MKVEINILLILVLVYTCSYIPQLFKCVTPFAGFLMAICELLTGKDKEDLQEYAQEFAALLRYRI